ncbi:MAG: YbjN domain-containing protein [Lachnospiraceae bacterium]|nr:YbjN domain-containing protein [Lachnospiraceae bacterium]
MAEYSAEMAAAVSRYLDMNRMRSRFDNDSGSFYITLPMETRLKQMDMEIRVGASTLISEVRIPLSCEPGAVRSVMEFVTRLNAALDFGGFVLDADSGDVSFRFSQDCAGVRPSYDMIDHLVSLPMIILGTYLDALISVMLGYAEAKKALQDAALKSISSD